MWWSGGLQTISGMFGNEGFFDLGSMILMSKNDINDVLGVLGVVWGCLGLDLGWFWKSSWAGSKKLCFPKMAGSFFPESVYQGKIA